MTLDAWEALLVELLRAPDPRLALDARLAGPDGDDPMLRAIDRDGLRVAGLIVARLRFDRLLAADREADRWFDEDGAAFTAAFRAYHTEVPATAFHPLEEAASWRAWRAAKGG